MKNFHLWALFGLANFLTSLLSFLLCGLLAYAGIRLGLLSLNDPAPVVPLMGFFVTALLFAASLVILTSWLFFKPIQKLILALKEVAAGNFKVCLPEKSWAPEIVQMNENFNKMVRELNSIELIQSDFIQNVSHEMKTPLAAIEGYASLLSASELPEEQRDYAMRILESSRRLTALTGNVLRLSRLENQHITPERRMFSLDEQLRQCILALEPLWSEKNLNLEVELPELFYSGCEDMLSQVWNNLLSNAIKFTPRGGEISVFLESSEASVSVVVRDSGIGMSEDVMRHIFDKFYQGDRSRSGHGNGLGLALVKRILALCGGEISVESRPGRGSVFRVTLPL